MARKSAVRVTPSTVNVFRDLGFWKDRIPDWNHMYDIYPQHIIQSGMQRAWEKGHVSLEICGTFLNWRDTQGYDSLDVEYLFAEALKWHISSFNAKSSSVPEEWMPMVNDWLRKMGYRFVLRKFAYPSMVSPYGQLPFSSWWVNKGVAPCYRDFQLALRLKNENRALVLVTGADIRTWLPGDAVCDDKVYLPLDLAEGEYDLQLGIVDRQNREPAVRLAVEGRAPDGWYTLGRITVKEGSYPVSARQVVDNP